MTFFEEGCLLRILIGENIQHKGKPLYEWLVIKARESGLAGATVMKGIMGYGANSRIHTSKILRLSEDLPVIIEIVDSKDNLETFLKDVDDVIEVGLATLEKADVRFYRHKKQNSARY
jgi:PII-like signaling protein